jgi:hypothetical protein
MTMPSDLSMLRMKGFFYEWRALIHNLLKGSVAIKINNNVDNVQTEKGLW